MASPLEALGAAAAIAQFVQYGLQLTSKAVEIYRSPTGSSRSMTEIEEISKTTLIYHDRMLSWFSRNPSPLSAEEEELQKVAKSCSETTTELLDYIHSIKPQGKANFLKCIVSAQKFESRKPTIEQYRHRLETLGGQLRGYLLMILSDRQRELANVLDGIERQNSLMADHISSSLQDQKNELLQQLKTSQRAKMDHYVLAQRLTDFQRESYLAIKRQKILESLKCDSLNERQDQITDVEGSSYDWMFQDTTSDIDSPPVKYIEWLQTGTGIYWVTGKAGCGKSTLMKHISGHPLSKKALEKWSAGCNLYIASHYFFNAGTLMQKSLIGLLQTLIYKVLCQYPESIEHACASRWAKIASGAVVRYRPWTLSELDDIVKYLSGAKIANHARRACFCFFIDGLDEYDGDHEELIVVIQRLANNNHIKVCASSRPWEVFIDSFDQSSTLGYRLDVHLYTKPDIIKFVHEKLDSHLVRYRHEDLDFLTNKITEDASGVFLWVRLVVQDLIRGLRHHDDIVSLRHRLAKIPKGLTKYLREIFHNLDPFYARETARIFKACMWVNDSLPINALEVIVNKDPESMAINESTEQNYNWNDDKMLVRLRKKLNGRCQDLLEMQRSTETEITNIVFLHRTVKEFLETMHMREHLDTMAGADFEVFKSLAAGYLFLLKKPTHLSTRKRKEVKDCWINAILRCGRTVEDVHQLTIVGILQELNSVLYQTRGDRQEATADGQATFRLTPRVVTYGLGRNLQELVIQHNHYIDRHEYFIHLSATLQQNPASVNLSMVRFLSSRTDGLNENVQWVGCFLTVWEVFLMHSLSTLVDEVCSNLSYSTTNFASAPSFSKIVNIANILIESGARFHNQVPQFFHSWKRRRIELRLSLPSALPERMKRPMSDKKVDCLSTREILDIIFGPETAAEMDRVRAPITHKPSTARKVSSSSTHDACTNEGRRGHGEDCSWLSFLPSLWSRGHSRQ